MKKLLLLLTLFSSVAWTACDDDKDNNDPQSNENYTGTLSVTKLSDPTQTSEFANKHFNLESAGKGTTTLRMYETQFVEQMPKLTLEVPGIAYTRSNNQLLLSGTKIVPQMGGTPYEQYVITNLTGTLTDAEPDDTLVLNFECMGFRVTYSGKEID